MQKTQRNLLIGVVGLAFVAAASTYFFSTKPKQSQALVGTGQSASSEDVTGTTPVLAVDVQKLLSSNACLGCHAIDVRLVGPSFRDVAAKYKDDDRALAKVAFQIRQGGEEQWGNVPMPPMPNVTEAQALQLAEWVLRQ
jgi:cytochrome c